MCASLLPDIVCIVESWLDDNIDDSEVCVQGYCLHRVDRNRHGGGILIYVKNVFSCSVMYSGSPEFEFIVLSINCSLAGSGLGCCCVALFYRPPGSDISLLDTLFSTLCDMFVLVPHQLLLIGDFNIDYLIPASSLYFKLQSIVSSFNLTQVVSEPTRVCKTSETLIDLIFVSSSVFVKKCSATPPLANADHNGLHLIVSLNLPVKRSKPVTRNIWRYSLADFDRAAELLETVEWVSLLPTDNVDSYWSTWKTYFLQIMEICIPHAVTKTKSNVPWMNRTIAERGIFCFVLLSALENCLTVLNILSRGTKSWQC